MGLSSEERECTHVFDLLVKNEAVFPQKNKIGLNYVMLRPHSKGSWISYWLGYNGHLALYT